MVGERADGLKEKEKQKIREEHIWSSGWNTRGVEVWGRGMGSSEDSALLTAAKPLLSSPYTSLVAVAMGDIELHRRQSQLIKHERPLWKKQNLIKDN